MMPLNLSGILFTPTLTALIQPTKNFFRVCFRTGKILRIPSGYYEQIVHLSGPVMHHLVKLLDVQSEDDIGRISYCRSRHHGQLADKQVRLFEHKVGKLNPALVFQCKVKSKYMQKNDFRCLKSHKR